MGVIRSLGESVRATIRFWASGPAEGETQVIQVLAERIKELLAGESFRSYNRRPDYHCDRSWRAQRASQCLHGDVHLANTSAADAEAEQAV